MANDLSLSIRIPSMLMARLDELREYLEADPDLAYLGEDLSRSMLVRLALQKGVEAMEEMYDVTPSSVTTKVTRASKVYRTSTRKISDRTRRHRAPTEPLNPLEMPERDPQVEGDEQGDDTPAPAEMADAEVAARSD